ncbi:MAG: prepilin-type N-terminal cleavage/methylation domain-containing protein [Candidatus Omnitrophica bacterium]|nr:prepilin-type N-terminal cleavage/methylation domain-containing protein [Candidatus Omnitrophota bacterium]
MGTQGYILKGLTLIEVMVAVSIILITLCGILATYVQMFFATDLMRDFSRVTFAVEAKMEEIKNLNFTQLSSLNNQRFAIEGFSPLDAQGVITVNDTIYSDLKNVRIVACFKSRDRLIGNGITNCTTSPVELITLIANFTQ